MSLRVRERWVNAGKIIAENPKKKVLCPVCQSDFLKVWDVPDCDGQSSYERHMLCDNCGAYNVLRMIKK